MHDVTLAVERVDAVEVEQQRRRPRAPRDRAASRQAPRCPSRCTPRAPRWLSRASSAVPSTSTLPSFITVTRSASANTRSMSCSTSSTGMSRRDALDQVADALALRWRRGRPAARRAAARAARDGERQAHVEQALAAVRQRPGFGVFDAGQPQEADQLRRARRHALDCAARRPSRRNATRRAPARRGAGSPRSIRAGNRLVIWNERRQPRRGNPVRRQPGDRLAGEHDANRGRARTCP